MPTLNDSMVLYSCREHVLAHAACVAPEHGLVLEFGVAGGSTVNFLATSIPLRSRRIWGFDSFAGLPARWGPYEVGHFACEPPSVAPNVGLIVGRFENTLEPFLTTHEDSVALVHIDCDLYDSVRTVLELLTPRIISGTTIVLDEYFIEVEHEQRAFHEWLSAHGRKCRHECRSVEQLCVTMQ